MTCVIVYICHNRALGSDGGDGSMEPTTSGGGEDWSGMEPIKPYESLKVCTCICTHVYTCTHVHVSICFSQ